MHGDPGDILTPLLDLTGVNSGSQLHTKLSGSTGHRHHFRFCVFGLSGRGGESRRWL